MSAIDLAKPALSTRLSPKSITEGQSVIIGEEQREPIDQFAFQGFLSRLNTELDENISRTQTGVNDNASRIATLESSASSLDTRLDTAESDINTIESTAAALAATVAKINNNGFATSGSSVQPATVETELVSKTITTTGGPVLVIAITTVEFDLSSSLSDVTATIKLYQDANVLQTSSSRCKNTTSATITEVLQRTQMIAMHLHTPAAGSRTYKITGISNSGTANSATFTEHQIVVIELKG
jgi:hypothetical protein